MSVRCEIEVYPSRGRTGAVGGDTWRHMWIPHRVKSPCRQGISVRLLLAHALQDATTLVTRCEACQFHSKKLHQPAQSLQTIPLSWPFSVWGLDILGPFPRAVGGFEYLYVAIDKFTKWPEVEAVRKVTTQAAVKFFKGLVCRFGVPNNSWNIEHLRK